MTNIFAWRDTLPENMKLANDPVGIENDHWITEVAAEAGIVVCAWGKHGSHRNRQNDVLALLSPFRDKVFALEIDSDGSLKHPLYIRADIQPKKFL